MPFLRFAVDDNDKLEWGFHVPFGYIPSIGDTVNLRYGLPDMEVEDAVDAKVVKRKWGFASDYEIWFVVTVKEQIPKGRIADSTEWPSSEHSAREEYARNQSKGETQ